MPCPSGYAHELEWKVLWARINLCSHFLVSFVRVWRRSFWNPKSTPLVSWFPFLCEQHQRRQKQKEQNKKLAHRVQGTLDFLL